MIPDIKGLKFALKGQTITDHKIPESIICFPFKIVNVKVEERVGEEVIKILKQIVALMIFFLVFWEKAIILIGKRK